VKPKTRPVSLADLPERLQAFRYADWCQPADADAAAARSGPNGGEGFYTFLIATAYNRYTDARKAWVAEQAPDHALSDLIERRRNRSAEWFAAVQELRRS
jgi:hypothetical protein